MSATVPDLDLGASSDVRHIRLTGTRNLRDVGGYRTADGRRTRWRTLLRTDRLDRLSPDAQAWLVAYGLRQVIDLRWPSELAAEPSVFASSPDVRYRSIPIFDENPPDQTQVAVYLRMLDERSGQIAAVARALLDPGGVPAVVGCAAGKDRTGVTIAVLLSAVGVERDAIVADYALSTECYATPALGADPDDPLDGAIAVDCDPAWIEATIDHLDRRHGGARRLLLENGLSEPDLDRLTDLLTEAG